MSFDKILSQKDLPTKYNKLKSLTWELLLRYRKLEEQLATSKRKQFGRSSEQLDDQSVVQEEMNELLSQLEDLSGLSAETEESAESTENEESVDVVTIKSHDRKKRRPGRNIIPEDIERTEEVLDVPEEEKYCDCCGEMKVEISRKKHTVIERIPAKYKATDYVRPLYACSKCKDAVTVAEPVLLPIPKGLAGPELLSFVIESKYQYHLPLYRIQRQIFHESGIWFTRSTLVSWIRGLHKGISRIHYEMLSIFKSSYLKHADETPLKVQSQKQKGKHHLGRMWAGIGKNNREGPLVAVFYYNDKRDKEAAKSFLKGSSSGDILMIDGCPSYNEAIKKYNLVKLYCMVHARRKFIEAMDSNYKKEYAKEIVDLIAKLYRIESWTEKYNLSSEKLGEIRKKYSTKILCIIKDRLLNPGFTILPSRKIGIAVDYMIKHWDGIIKYCDSGEYPIDNNPVERVIRPLTIGRKNWGCAGSENGAKWIAAWYSIIATCQLNGINFHNYITDVIMRLPLRPKTMDVKDLTPLEWAKNNNANINTCVQYPKS